MFSAGNKSSSARSQIAGQSRSVASRQEGHEAFAVSGEPDKIQMKIRIK
jgi:hypothetical protein